jgi:hypothetical protein
MRRTLVPRIAAAAVIAALLGAVVYLRFWDPTPTYESVVDDGASRTTPAELATVAERRMFFGHMSVGNNILSGLDSVYAAHGVAAPALVEITPGESAELPPGGVVAHALIGENRHPVGKLANFDATLRAGLADQVDVAALKFCYIDIRWNSDVDALFARYRATLDRLEADYPDVRFVHMTAPLTTGPHGIKDHLKVLLGRDDNAAREHYNDLMRAAYGPDRLFDLAALEATDPDGTVGPSELFAGYSVDGAHLNGAGSTLIAAELVDFLAAGDR